MWWKVVLVAVSALALIAALALSWWGPSFLGGGQFEGSYKPDTRIIKALAGVSSYDGKIVYAEIDRNLVADVLPPSLRLADPKGPVVTKHPIILIYGKQKQPETTLLGPPPLPIADYDELILIIPFVQSTNGSHWHNYVVRMYLDSPAAVFGGNVFFGYRKELAELDDTSGFDVSQSGILRFEAADNPTSAWMSAAEADMQFTHFKDLREIMEMPILGTKDFMYVCSYFVWNFDNADLRRIHTSFRFVSKFTAGMNPWTNLGPLSEFAANAFEVRNLHWWLYFPLPYCQF